MNSNIEYTCSTCGERKERNQLKVKKVVFYEMGPGGKMLRSRVVGWICEDNCLPDDPHWNKQPMNFQNKQKVDKDA